MTVPSQPPVVYLKGLSAEIANESMDGLLHEAMNDSATVFQHLLLLYDEFSWNSQTRCQKNIFHQIRHKMKGKSNFFNKIKYFRKVFVICQL